MKPAITTLHHVNDIHAPLTYDALHGTGLYNEANRKATEAGLLASPLNHPRQPRLAGLPQQQSPLQPQQQSTSEVNFVHAAQAARPSFLGPQTEALPPANVIPPQVQEFRAVPQQQQPQQQQTPTPALHANENAFIEGLPSAFMELDAETQLQILALADAKVDLDADSDSDSDSETEAETEVDNESEADSDSDATSESESDADSEQDQESESDSESESESEEETPAALAEIRSAAKSLEVLAELHKSTHVPFAKLIHMLAAKNQEE